MDDEAVIASYAACVRAGIAPIVADLEALADKMRTDTAKIGGQLSMFWLALVPVQGHA